MSWVSIILSIVASMFLMLVAVHVHVWVRDRTAVVWSGGTTFAIAYIEKEIIVSMKMKAPREWLGS